MVARGKSRITPSTQIPWEGQELEQGLVGILGWFLHCLLSSLKRCELCNFFFLSKKNKNHKQTKNKGCSALNNVLSLAVSRSLEVSRSADGLLSYAYVSPPAKRGSEFIHQSRPGGSLKTTWEEIVTFLAQRR